MLGLSRYGPSTPCGVPHGQTPGFDPDFPDFLSGPVTGHRADTRTPFSIQLFSPMPVLTKLSEDNTQEGDTQTVTPCPANTVNNVEPDTTVITPPNKFSDTPRGHTDSESPATSPDDATNPSGGKKSRTVTKRTVFTQAQLAALERRFVEQSFLSREERQELAERLRISERQVMVWFQNRRGRLKKRGPADMAYNPMKLNEVNNRRPYPFLYGMLSSMHYQTPHQQVWSMYPDEVKSVAASAIDEKQTTKCGGKMPSAMSNRALYRAAGAASMNPARDVHLVNGVTSPPMTSCHNLSAVSLRLDGISPVSSPENNIVSSSSPRSTESQSPVQAQGYQVCQNFEVARTQQCPGSSIQPANNYQSNYYTGPVVNNNSYYNTNYENGYYGYQPNVYHAVTQTMPPVPMTNATYAQSQVSNMNSCNKQTTNHYGANFWNS